MIRINLLKNFGANSSEVLKQIEDQKQVQTQFVKKFLVLMLGVLALFGYEQYNIPLLRQEQGKAQVELNELIAFNQKKEALKAEIEKYEKDRIRLNRQTEFLQMIQNDRTLTLDLLVKVKELIPTNLWLTSIKMSGKMIEIRGEADSERQINEFNQKLAALNFLKDVVVLSIELKTSRDLNSNLQIKVFVLKASFSEVSSSVVTGGRE